MSWNPLQDLMVLQDRMNRLFKDATQRRAEGERGADLEQAEWYPLADVIESDSEYIISLDLPGIDRSALEITIEDNRLVVRGNRNLEPKTASRSERQGGRFLRNFTVPNVVDQNNIRADYKDGVLDLYLPKRRVQTAKKVEINIS